MCGKPRQFWMITCREIVDVPGFCFILFFVEYFEILRMTVEGGSLSRIKGALLEQIGYG